MIWADLKFLIFTNFTSVTHMELQTVKFGAARVGIKTAENRYPKGSERREINRFLNKIKPVGFKINIYLI